MYASYGRDRRRFNPTSMGAAIAINGAVLAALIFSAPELLTPPPDNDLEVVQIDLPKPPPPAPRPEPPIERAVNPPPRPEPVAPDPIVPSRVEPIDIITIADPAPFPDITIPLGGTGTTVVEPPPALVPATRDPRYAEDFQPLYPSSERRAGKEGRVTVRVLIGTDGRVKRVERKAAASDAFYEATRRQALSRWRFRPATRGGVPVESWQTLTVRFVLEG